MGQLVFQATLGGQVNLVGPNTASTFNINVPATSGNMVTTGDTGTVTATMLASTTGSGAVVLATSATLVTPALGTPSALVGTNITGTAAGLSIGGNAATATTATNVSGGTSSVTSETVSGNLTLSGGTANGVAYLNGSKVVTTGSALVFDGANLGLGVTPSAWGGTNRKAFQLPGATAIEGSTAIGLSLYQNAYYNGTNDTYIANGAAYKHEIGTGYIWKIAPSGTAGNAITFTQAMTLDASGNLLLGGTTAKATGQTIYGASQATDSFGNLAIVSTTSAAADAGGSICMAGYDSTTTRITNFAVVAGRKENSTNTDRLGYLSFATSNASGSAIERARIDSSGNLGLGVTPSAWTPKALQIGLGASFIGGTSFNTTDVGNNIYGNYSYLATGQASFYRQYQGAHSWYNAASGTAGNAITFTQAMTLDASGNLLVGKTATTVSVAGVWIVPSGGINITSNSSSGGYVAGFYNSGSVSSVGSIQTTSIATLYNTSSDQRLKENIQDAAPASALIDSLQVREYDWKSDGSHQRYGFIAQELVTVAPEAVHQPADPEEMMAVDYSKLVPMLVKEIQDLRKRLAAAGI